VEEELGQQRRRLFGDDLALPESGRRRGGVPKAHPRLLFLVVCVGCVDDGLRLGDRETQGHISRERLRGAGPSDERGESLKPRSRLRRKTRKGDA
jgi:hypothetical protein